MQKKIIALIIATCVLPLFATTSSIKNFKVLAINGKQQVQYKTKNGFQKIELNKTYPFGTMIKTGRKSTVDLQFSPKNTCRVMPRTILTIKENIKNPKIKILSLQKGSVNLTLDNFPRDHKLQVETPTAICGALGTHFAVSFEDDPDPKKAEAKHTTRETTFECSKGKIFIDSNFTIKNKKCTGKTFTVPVLEKGGSITAKIHEGVENSYSDITVNSGTLTINYGIKNGGTIIAKADKNKPVNIITAMEKSKKTVAASAIKINQGTAKYIVSKGVIFKKQQETILTPKNGAVLLYHKAVIRSDKNKPIAEYLQAAQQEAEMHSQIVEKRQAKLATQKDEENLKKATQKATKLRKAMLSKRVRKMLQHNRRNAARATRVRHR